MGVSSKSIASTSSGPYVRYFLDSQQYFKVILQLPKPNSWTYNVVEVSVHNLESSQVSVYNVELQTSFKPLLLKGRGGVKSVSRLVSRGDCE